MKIRILFLFVLQIYSIHFFAQKINLLNGIDIIQNRHHVNVIKGYISVVDERGLNDVLNKDYPVFVSEIPSNEFGDIEKFDFVQFDLLSSDFEVITSSNKEIQYQKGKYYSVISENDSKTGTFSFYRDKLMGIYSDKNGNNYNLGVLSNQTGK
ncbi:MAG TPA: hypothetical protein ENK91_07555, partial [Bacteroidetes bacterium]|nr:hypothetical protein [Bacteroidota bacterium]